MEVDKKKIEKFSKKLESIDRSIRRIEILIVKIFEHRFGEPSEDHIKQHERPPPGQHRRNKP